MSYVCIKCKKPVSGTEIKCCDIDYVISEDKISYGFEKYLYEKFGNDYLLNKVLNNNGHLSYLYLPEGSLSVDHRDDVKAFSEFISSNYKSGNVLDVGCGINSMPGYLLSINNKKNNLFGLDPLSDTEFEGHKVIGCAEFIPYSDNYFDTIIFATSIDHVCNLKQTFKEALRVLKKDGKLIIWHACPPKISLYTKLLGYIVRVIQGKNVNKSYYYYPEDDVVFYVPKGAVDPYHKEYMQNKTLIKRAENLGFKLQEAIDFDHSSSFLVFNPTL